MAYSTQRVVSDGSLVLLSVSIGYLERQHVHVFFDNIEDSLPWAWVGATNQISFSPAVPNGVEVLVARKTDPSAPYHVFTQGAQFTAESLDEDIWQILYIAQEATEQASTGEFFMDVNMHSYKITNVADAVSAQDVMTLGQAQEVMQPYVDAAAASAVAADTGADAAAISAANALVSENASAASAAASAASAITEVNNGSTNAVLKTSGTGSMKVPAGTTAERDAAPVYGAQRANSTLNIQEWWNGAAWVSMSESATSTQTLGLSTTASENHFWDGSVPNQLLLKRGTPVAPGAEIIKAVGGIVVTPLQTGPAFAAFQVGGQTFTSAVASKINNAGEYFDTNNCYDAANSRFTPNAAGYYQVNLIVSVTAATALTVLGAYVRKNGATPSELAAFSAIPSGTFNGAVNVSGLVYLNGTTDYIEPWVIATGTGTLTANATANSFSASLARTIG